MPPDPPARENPDAPQGSQRPQALTRALRLFVFFTPSVVTVGLVAEWPRSLPLLSPDLRLDPWIRQRNAILQEDLGSPTQGVDPLIAEIP